jgi:predicted nucleic acid-binding protein
VKLLIDTNIVVDVYSGREGADGSLQVLRLCEARAVAGYITTNSITDIHYVLRKYIGRKATHDALLTTLSAMELIEISQSDILKAFEHPLSDFEDAIIENSAVRNGIDYIVTRNVSDFKKARVPAVTPEKFLTLHDGATSR